VASRIVWNISAPALGLAALLLVVTLVASWTLYWSQRTADAVLKETLQTAQAAEQAETTLHQMQSRLHAYLRTGDPSHLREALGLRNQADRLLLEIEQLSMNGEPPLTIFRLRRQRLAEQLPRSMADAVDPGAIDQWLSEPATDEMLAEVTRLRQQRARELNSAIADSQSATSYLRTVLLLLGFGGAAAGALAGWGIARGVRQSLVELSVPVRNAAGSLSAVVGPVRVTGDGTIPELEASLTELSDKVSTVVSRLQAAEHESLRSEQMAALGQLAAGLAHELRNPLTAIQTLVEAAREESGGGALRGRDLEVLEEEISRLNRSIQSFLDYARPPRLERRPVDLRDVVEKTRQLLAPRAQRQEIELQAVVPDSPVVVPADTEQLRQVALNLALNAFDAVGHTGRVTMEVSSNGRGEALLTVADTGPGIPESVQGRLFEPFVSSKESGTGLGLTICRRIVEQHGGTIEAANRREGGAMLSVHLPA
jgi:signal transduction histidine kinase